MMKGIDISNWQAGIDPSKLNIDFCICKATEGLNFVDRHCDGFIQACIKRKIPFGFYHFARNGNPEKEAKYFYDNCKGYIGKGIPVLDYEVDNANNRIWCEKFLKRFHELSGIWPMLYISASRCPQCAGSWIPGKCGLWCAGYPDTRQSWRTDDIPYDVAPWKFCAIWQFTDNLRLKGYTGALDGDIAYMDEKAWSSYATSKKQNGSSSDEDAKKSTGKTCEELAKEVLQGKWGNGWNRKNALDKTYGEGTYEHVQAIVNRLAK